MSEFIKLEAREKANEIRMKVCVASSTAGDRARAQESRTAALPRGPSTHRCSSLLPTPDPPAPLQTKADADLEKQMAVLNAKTKLAEEFDRKEKDLAMQQRV